MSVNKYLFLLKFNKSFFFRYHLPNGSYTGAIGEIITNQSDISLTGFFIKDYLTRKIEFTSAVYSDKLCCYVPKASRVPYSILPFFSVHYSIWIGFVISGFGISVIWMTFRYWNLRLLSNILICWRKDFIKILIDSWVIWVRIQLNRYPPFHSEKILIISISLVSVIFGAIFESSLATVYITPLHYKDIMSLKELDESGYEIEFKHAAMKDDLFKGSVSETFIRLGNKLKFIQHTTEPIIKTMARTGGFAGITRESSLELDDIYYLGTDQIFKIPECPKEYTIAYVLIKNSPFTDTINNLLLRMDSGGLLKHWIKEIYFEKKISNLVSNSIKWDENKLEALSLKHLQLAFYILILGNLTSIVCFSLEYFKRLLCVKF